MNILDIIDALKIDNSHLATIFKLLAIFCRKCRNSHKSGKHQICDSRTMLGNDLITSKMHLLAVLSCQFESI